jgi:hypothetical protein
MKRLWFAAAAASLTVAAAWVSLSSGAEEKEITIKQVMKKAHSAKKGELKLCEKVVMEKASADEKKELLGLYTAMAKTKPPKGDADSWKEKTGALVAAAKACVDDDKDGPPKLKKAVNCGACHKEHKGK